MTCPAARAAARFAFLIALGVGRFAGADMIAASPSAYTPINLGPDATIGTDAAGNRILIATDGQRYSFPGTSPTAYSADALAKLGTPLPYYDNSGGPNSQGIQPAGGIANSDGTFVAATYTFGRYTDMNTASLLYTFHQDLDGSYTPADVLAGQRQAAGFMFTDPMTPIDINKTGLILYSHAYNPGNSAYSLYDLKTGTSTALPISIDPSFSQTPTLQGLALDAAVKLDDDGRILFNADRTVDGQTENDLVLLTPAGLATDPLPTPEPSTLLVLGLSAAGWLAHRRRQP